MPDYPAITPSKYQAWHDCRRNTRPLGKMLRDIMRDNMSNFRVFGRTRTAQQARQRLRSQQENLVGRLFAGDAVAVSCSPDGRVMEMLSEHTLEGWLEGYLLTGRHGFSRTYEAFVHVIDSMFTSMPSGSLCQGGSLARAGVVAESADHLHVWLRITTVSPIKTRFSSTWW